MIKETFYTESFGLSDIGLVREHNEDVWAAFPEKGLFVLADGMGGHLAGEIASKEAIDHLHSLVGAWNPSQEITVEEAMFFFRDALVKVSTCIYKKGRSSEELKGMGTTLVALFFLQNHAILAHVGDSRAYRQRDTGLEQLTEDHSFVSELVSLGAMKPEDAETFPYKHILTRAIGTHPNVEPTVNSVEVQPHDLFMLCSDGLTNYITDNEIANILRIDDSLTHKGQQLVDLSNEHGGGDNITLVLINIHNDLLG